MIWLNRLSDMQEVTKALSTQFPHLSFRAGRGFYWSAPAGEVVYRKNAQGQRAIWSLLHETSHALLSHESYHNDFELIEMEVAAWERAKHLANDLGLPAIDEGHLQDCLDTYRDWLHKRSVCPNCATKSLQATSQEYHCFNCGTQWRVTPSRFCRTYRATIAA
jgi:hypothetical protein